MTYEILEHTLTGDPEQRIVPDPPAPRDDASAAAVDPDDPIGSPKWWAVLWAKLSGATAGATSAANGAQPADTASERTTPAPDTGRAYRGHTRRIVVCATAPGPDAVPCLRTFDWGGDVAEADALRETRLLLDAEFGPQPTTPGARTWE